MATVTLQLTDDERRTLRTLAAENDMTIGLFAKALVSYGVAHVEDQAIQDSLAEERRILHEKRSATTKANAHRRWGTEADTAN